MLAGSYPTSRHAPMVGTILDGSGTPAPIYHVRANVNAGTTDATFTDVDTGSALAAAPSGKRYIWIAFFAIVGGTATNVTLNTKGGGAGTAISQIMACGANGGVALAFNVAGWFKCALAEQPTVTTGAGAAAGLSGVLALV